MLKNWADGSHVGASPSRPSEVRREVSPECDVRDAAQGSHHVREERNRTWQISLAGLNTSKMIEGENEPYGLFFAATINVTSRCTFAFTRPRLLGWTPTAPQCSRTRPFRLKFHVAGGSRTWRRNVPLQRVRSRAAACNMSSRYEGGRGNHAAGGRQDRNSSASYLRLVSSSGWARARRLLPRPVEGDQLCRQARAQPPIVDAASPCLAVSPPHSRRLPV